MIWWVILLFAIGITLVMAEFFLPGLVCGVLGALFIAGSCMVALNWHPEHAALIIVGEIAAVIASIAGGFYMVARTPVGKAMILSGSQKPDAGWVSDETDASLLGATGKVFTALRPAGTIVVRDKKVTAVSTGNFIEDGTLVKVIEVSGNRVVVEPVFDK